MKSFSSVLLIALAFGAVVLTSVNAFICTADNCQGLSVTQRFSDTPDCTGNYTIRSGTNLTQGCIDLDSGLNTSLQYTCSDGLFSIATYYSANVPNCASSAFIKAEFTRTGICTRTGTSSSSVTWCSYAEALASTPSPSPSYVNATIFSSSNGDACNATTGCGAGVSTVAIYNTSDCGQNSFLGTLPVSYVVIGAQLDDNVCYVTNRSSSSYDNRLNVKATCGNSVYRIAAYAGCASSAPQLNGYTYQANKCFPLSTDRWGFIKCDSSAAGTINFSVALLMIVAALLSALIL